MLKMLLRRQKRYILVNNMGIKESLSSNKFAVIQYIKILELSIEEWANMGLNGRKFVDANFDKEIVVIETIKAIEYKNS